MIFEKTFNLKLVDQDWEQLPLDNIYNENISLKTMVERWSKYE